MNNPDRQGNDSLRQNYVTTDNTPSTSQNGITDKRKNPAIGFMIELVGCKQGAQSKVADELAKRTTGDFEAAKATVHYSEECSYVLPVIVNRDMAIEAATSLEKAGALLVLKEYHDGVYDLVTDFSGSPEAYLGTIRNNETKKPSGGFLVDYEEVIKWCLVIGFSILLFLFLDWWLPFKLLLILFIIMAAWFYIN